MRNRRTEMDLKEAEGKRSKNQSQKKKRKWGTSLVVQWLRLHASTAGGMGSISALGELRSCMLHGGAKKKKKKKNSCLGRWDRLG